tara:strand:+ start:83 stop:652 length:570 start_codon:yes stop_codon:yes gene_type:complete
VKYIEHIETVKNTVDSIDASCITEEVLSEFSKSKRIVFCTMGKSAFACKKIVYSARSFGLDWHDLDVCHAFHGDIGIVREDDLIVLVSKSGETKETVAVAKYLKNKKISITSNENCSLSSLCDYSVVIPLPDGEASPYGFAPMISTALYMIILHGVLCHVVEAKDIGLKTLKVNHPEGNIGALLEDVKC